MTQSRPPHLTPEQSLAAARRILTAAIKAAPGCEGEALFHGLMLWLDETKISSDDPDIEHASRAIASLSAKMAALGGVPGRCAPACTGPHRWATAYDENDEHPPVRLCRDCGLVKP